MHHCIVHCNYLSPSSPRAFMPLGFPAWEPCRWTPQLREQLAPPAGASPVVVAPHYRRRFNGPGAPTFACGQAPVTPVTAKRQPSTSWPAGQRKQGFRHVETDHYAVVELQASSVHSVLAHVLLQLASFPAPFGAGSYTSFLAPMHNMALNRDSPKATLLSCPLALRYAVTHP